MAGRVLVFAVVAIAASVSPRGCPAAATQPAQHNAVIFVADGLRGAWVDAQTAPELYALRQEGVAFPNSHALYPTVTTANASAIATGHYLGDTGNFANTLFVGYPAGFANGAASVTPFIEDDTVLRDLDRHFSGDYLHETTLLAAARARGFSTAAIGKLGPTLIQDHTDRSGGLSIIIDDRSGFPDGIPIDADLADRLRAEGLAAPMPASDKPNVAQQQYLTDVVTKAVLPLFKQRGKPFVLVFWSRDPDSTQHGQLDSRFALVPGINGSTSLAAIRNADDSLKRLRAALHALDLERTTDIFVTSDHGFSTISKQSDSSAAARRRYDDIAPGYLPFGFLALDLAATLDLPLYDPDRENERVDTREPRHPSLGNGLLGHSAADPDFVVTAGGGSDFVYILTETGQRLAPIVVTTLLAQDYVGGIFVDDQLGRFAGTLPLSAINLVGSARLPRPSIVVSFRSFATGCPDPLRCGAELADTGLDQGQGMHGSFSRADTFNFMAAIGPDFKRRFSDPAPVSNADLAPTLARALGIALGANGRLSGRVIEEALPDGKLPAFSSATCGFAAATIGRGALLDQPPLLRLQPALKWQSVGATRYFDAAGLVGRTLGLEDPPVADCER